MDPIVIHQAEATALSCDLAAAFVAKQAKILRGVENPDWRQFDAMARELRALAREKREGQSEDARDGRTTPS